MLSALARWCARHRALVVLLWVALAVGLLAGSRAVDGGTVDDVAVPGSDSEAANELLTSAGATDPNRSEMILTARDGEAVDSPRLRAAVQATTRSVADVSGVEVDPDLAQPSPKHTAVRFAVALDPGVTADTQLGQRVLDAAQPARAAGMDVAIGGALGRKLSALDSQTSELIGVAAALLVLLLAFGSAVAALLPVVTAVVVVVAGLAGLTLLAGSVSIPDVAPTVAAMIGLGVGVDYTLFLVNRQRGLLARGLSTEDAAARTAGSAGVAVVFAGATVVVSISGLMLTGIEFVSWLGWSAALLVIGAVASAMTLTPALLAIAGARLRRGRPAAASDADLDGGFWGRFASWSTRRPVAVALASVVLLLALGAPTLALRLGQSNAGDRGPHQQLALHYKATEAGWGAGANGLLTVVLADPRQTDRAVAVLGEIAGIASVEEPRPLPSGAVSVRVVPETGPSDPDTVGLVARLRGEILPEFGEAHVGGGTATRIDLANRISDRLPLLILAVIGVACVLLLFAFRSLLLPVKAALMNLVSVCAAYGVVTAVFQWGWGATLLGLEGPVPIDSYVPMVLFAVLFGLSMDYEVFLLSAVQEHWARTADNRTAVRRGVAETGGVITSAALIMVCVFASFVLVDNPIVKIFGLGLATAIVVDATVVRCLLVPATMVLLGRWNWWLPHWLDRLLPHFLDHRDTDVPTTRPPGTVLDPKRRDETVDQLSGSAGSDSPAG